MKLWILGTLSLLGLISFYACGSPTDENGDPNSPNVNGSAVFGTQCPYGTYSAAKAAPLYLWDCPMNLETFELVEPLRPIVLQADCKKKVVVARSMDGALDTSWEALPDGTFSFKVDGGNAKVRKDGQGASNCEIPLVAEVSGKMTCGDRDKVTLTVESVWWMDREAAPPSPRPSASPRPSSSPLPSSSPSYTPSPWPSQIPTSSPLPSHTPTFTPSPLPSPSPTRPTPTPTVTVVPSPRPIRQLAINSWFATTQPTAQRCKVPKGCYLYANVELNQCD